MSTIACPNCNVPFDASVPPGAIATCPRCKLPCRLPGVPAPAAAPAPQLSRPPLRDEDYDYPPSGIGVSRILRIVLWGLAIGLILLVIFLGMPYGRQMNLLEKINAHIRGAAHIGAIFAVAVGIDRIIG